MNKTFSIHGLTSAELAACQAVLAGSESKAKPEAKAKPKRKAKAKAKADEPAADGAVAEKPAEVTPACKESKPSKSESNGKPEVDPDEVAKFEHAELTDVLFVGMTKAIPGKRKDKTTAIAVLKEGSSEKGAWCLFYRLGVNKRGVYLWSMKGFNGKMKFLSPDEITDRMEPTEDNAGALVELEDK